MSWPGLTHGCPVQFLQALERHLSVIGWRFGWGCKQSIDALQVHEVLFDEPCEVEQAQAALLNAMSELQEKIDDESDRDLNANRVFGRPKELLDLEVLLHPAEGEFDFPAALVERGDILGAGIQVVREKTQGLAGFNPDADFADRVAP
jgi:hypothetical protein